MVMEKIHDYNIFTGFFQHTVMGGVSVEFRKVDNNMITDAFIFKLLVLGLLYFAGGQYDIHLTWTDTDEL